MPSTATPSVPRREPERSITWPPTIRIVTEDDHPKGHKTAPASISATPQHEFTHGAFEDDLDNHPEDHFLSPIQMYEYEDWAEDSDSDAEEVEWDAGITDFALFDSDRRRAQQTSEPLPSRWNDMLSQQASALQRAVERKRGDSEPNRVNRPLLSEYDVPSLTPDSSPNLRDDLDVESYHGQDAPRPSVPNYLTITITPPEDDDPDRELDDDSPLSFYVTRKQMRTQPNRRLERPGLRHSRTMSGQVHSWRRPSYNMYTVGEDAEAERKAELGMIRRVSSEGEIEDVDRGRR